MAERVLKCPQCGGGVTPSRFARRASCPYCGSLIEFDEEGVSAAVFREAFEAWDSPSSGGFGKVFTVEGRHWELGRFLARGEVSDVHFARRARWPTQRVLLKVLREPAALPRFEAEGALLESLQSSVAPGAATFCRLLPKPLLRGRAGGGVLNSAAVMAFLWEDGFSRSLADVLRAKPSGIEPRQTVWVWRRLLEVIAFLHASGVVHGAVLPWHLLVEDNEHGLRLVGFGAAGPQGAPMGRIPSDAVSFYPPLLAEAGRLTPHLDVAMSARCIAALLGGDAGTGRLPSSVPEPLAALVRETGWSPPVAAPPADAWTLRERLGTLAGEVFGPPRFCPIALP